MKLTKWNRIMKRSLSALLALIMVLGMVPPGTIHAHGAEGEGPENPFAGKKVSILSHSMSTYAGVSNNTAYNTTIGSNDIYYTEGRHDVYREDTWWQQAIDALGMELLVNNSWSGSCVFKPRKGAASVGYGDRAVNLHNDHTGEEPDIIWIYLGCNDFAYYQDTFGNAEDVDYAALIRDNGNGTYAYAIPETTCEAYAIMLHKVHNRYPQASIYCMTSTARRETDYTGDSYPDAGQPTQYSAQLQRIAEHFGYPVIDLEKAIPKEIELFDKYMGDKRAHANALGMDRITNALLTVMLGRTAQICHVTSQSGAVAEQAVLLGGSYRAEVDIRQGYSVRVTMDNKEITDEVFHDGKITIAEVTGDIQVETVVKRDPLNFRWEFNDGEPVSVGSAENMLDKLSGTVSNGTVNNGIFRFATPVVLKHDYPWSVAWSCAGDWRGAVLSSHVEAETKGMTYLSRVNGGQLCFGTYTGARYDNYGIDISYLDSEIHTYRLENRIAGDGSNMVWLYIDGTEIGPMNNYFIGSKAQNTTSDWVSGKDFVFCFIGINGHALRNCRLDDFSIQEAGPEETDSFHGDDFVSVEEAALQIRQYMKNRAENFSIRIRSTNDYPWDDFNKAWDLALAHTGNPVEGDYLAFHFGSNRQTYTSYQSGGVYYYTFTVTMSYRSTLQQEQEMDIAVDALLEQLDVWDKSDYEKVCAVYDYICKNVVYDDAHLNDDSYTLKYSAYAALINKTAVCQGYTLLLYRLLLELGIDNRIISGQAFGGDHGWNIVELDGLYYNADPTWDAGRSGYPFFLKNMADFGSRYRDNKYDSPAFHRAYPMAPVSYGTDIEPLLIQLTPDVWYEDQYYYKFTPAATGEYTLYTYILSYDDLVDYDAMCTLYDSDWDLVDVAESAHRRIQLKAQLQAGKTYYYAIHPVNGELPRVRVMLKAGEEQPGTGRLENATHADYAISDLVLGNDGIYRTPEGRYVYIAFDNVLDGGLTCLDGDTIFSRLSSSISDALYGLMKLEDEFGYVILNEYTLSFLNSLIKQDDAAAQYLFYDSSEESSLGALPVRILTQDEMTTVTALPDGEAAWYAYRPAQAGYYSLSAYSDNYDTYCQTDGMAWIDYPVDDDSRGDRDFWVTLYMEAGTVYYFLVSCKDAPADAAFRIQLTAHSRESMTTELFADSSIPVPNIPGFLYQYYAFTPMQSGNYRLYAFSENGVPDVSGILFDSGWNILSYSYSDSDLAFYIDSRLEAGKTYYYQVDNRDAAIEYQLVLRNLDTPPTVHPLALGVSNTIAIPIPGLSGYGAFTPIESGMYTFRVSSPDAPLYLEITDSDGNILADNVDEEWTRAYTVELWLEAGETYSCTVWHYDYRDGSMEVLITRPDAEISVGVLQLNQAADVVIDRAGQYAYYRFDSTWGGSYLLTVHADTPVVCKVFDANWQVVKTVTLCDDNQYSLSMNFYGTYYIAVAYQEAGRTGRFPLILSPDAAQLTLDTPATVTIAQEYTHGLYAYTPAVSGYYVLEADSRGGRTDCILLNSDLNQIGSSSTGNANDFRMWHWLEAGQIYYFEVSYIHNGTGTFDICLSYKADDDGANAKKYLITDTPIYSSVSGYPFGNRVTEHWFIPRESGYYTLASTDSDAYISCELLADGVQPVTSGSDGFDFTLRAWLDAGTEYCYRIHLDSSYSSASFRLLLTYEDNEGEDPGFPVLPLDTPVTASIEVSAVSACYAFTPAVSGFYTFTADSGGYDTCCYLYDAQWNYYRGNDDAGSSRDFRLTAQLSAGETYYFEVRFYGTDADRVGTIQLLLKKSDGIVASGKVENTLGIFYTLADLALGEDGIYRTPDGCAVYIAVDNQSDGGLHWMNGKTLADYVAHYGSQMFDLADWDALLALADKNGYALLTQTALQYLITTITGNPNWMENEYNVPNYLFYDLTPDSETGLPGDINGDGDVNNKDLTRLFKHLSGYTVEVVERALDVNGDGSVNNKDLTRLFRYLSGYDVEIH